MTISEYEREQRFQRALNEMKPEYFQVPLDEDLEASELAYGTQRAIIYFGNSGVDFVAFTDDLWADLHSPKYAERYDRFSIRQFAHYSRHDMLTLAAISVLRLRPYDNLVLEHFSEEYRQSDLGKRTIELRQELEIAAGLVDPE